MDSFPELLTVKQLQQQLKLSKHGAYNLVKDPDFPTVRIGRKILIPADKLQLWIDNGGSKKEGEHNGSF